MLLGLFAGVNELDPDRVFVLHLHVLDDRVLATDGGIELVTIELVEDLVQFSPLQPKQIPLKAEVDSLGGFMLDALDLDTQRRDQVGVIRLVVREVDEDCRLIALSRWIPVCHLHQVDSRASRLVIGLLGWSRSGRCRRGGRATASGQHQDGQQTYDK